MDAVRDQRAIVDPRDLTAPLDAIAAARETGPAERAAVLAALRDALAAGRAEVRERFTVDNDGRRAGRELAFLIDQLLRSLHEFTTMRVFPLANPSAAERLALVAVGGYGRGELAPHSDVDILFLLPYKLTPHGEQVIEYLLYLLWDLGLKIGHATRSVDECIRQAKADMTIRTALLESRFLTGDQKLFQELRQRFAKDVVAATGLAFVEAKLAERKERHRRMGNSRYALEPNIKEGKGGLRDLHALFWIAKYLYKVDDIATLIDRGVFTQPEVASFEKAEAFLWSVRFHLHYLVGRPEERLTFDLQPELARRLGYTDHAGSQGVERLMKHYFLVAKSVGDLTRIFCAALEAAQRKPGFRLPDFGLVRQEIEGFRGRPRRSCFAQRRCIAAAPGRHAAHLRGSAAERPRHPPGQPAADHPESASRGSRPARRSGSEPPLPRHADIAEGSGDGTAAVERGLRLWPLRPGLRPRRRADAIRHVPPLHGRRAHAVRHRHPLAHRAGSVEGRGAGRQPRRPPGAVAPRPLSRGHAARHRQGPRRRPFGAGGRGRAQALPAAGPDRRRDGDRRLVGPLSPHHEQHRLQARHRRSADHHRFRRAGAVAGTPA